MTTCPSPGLPVPRRCWQLSTTPPALTPYDRAELLAGHFVSLSDLADAFTAHEPQVPPTCGGSTVRAVLVAAERQCWSIVCRRCGMPLPANDDDGLPGHYPDARAARIAAGEAEWEPLRPVDGQEPPLLCDGCLSGMRLGELVDTTRSVRVGELWPTPWPPGSERHR